MTSLATTGRRKVFVIARMLVVKHAHTFCLHDEVREIDNAGTSRVLSAYHAMPGFPSVADCKRQSRRSQALRACIHHHC